ncbi:EPIDERMAL PATTERNING FACTOR-like protein 9 isoform X2 [Apium graveolens]|uniref:EPIDERMAL PATTERNING FACTOR-like protein 9 isoform X2 n=1 Tax=Apium graveolens TaxID=4045 RepID=UPI003D7A5462
MNSPRFLRYSRALHAYCVWFSTRVVNPRPQNIHASAVLGNDLQVHGKEWIHSNARRLMIGSVAPTCTYNECRGCRFRCRAEQVPVEGNDPMNSAYHYKCICHR